MALDTLLRVHFDYADDGRCQMMSRAIEVELKTPVRPWPAWRLPHIIPARSEVRG